MNDRRWFDVASMDCGTERRIEFENELKYHSLVDAHIFIPHTAEEVPVMKPFEIPGVGWVIRQIRKVFK